MRVRFLFLTALLGLFSISGFAQTIYRVQAGQSLPNALTTAAAGDIIYVDGGIYGDITISKQVTLIGTGYFAAVGAAPTGEARLGIVRFIPGAAGSLLTGFVTTGELSVGASNVTIVRNLIGGSVYLGYAPGIGSAGWGATANNVTVRQNFIDGELMAAQTQGTGTVLNFSFRNNIVRNGFLIGSPQIAGEFVNNTFGYAFDAGSYTSYNSPQDGSCLLITSVRFRNNIFVQSAAGFCAMLRTPSVVPPVFIGNVMLIDVAFPNVIIPGTRLTAAQLDNLFVGRPIQGNMPAMAPDARAQLKAGSVALTAGEGGTQAGAFGGDDPYVLSGIPFIPSITELTVPPTVTQGGTLNITVKAQSNN